MYDKTNTFLNTSNLLSQVNTEITAFEPEADEQVRADVDDVIVTVEDVPTSDDNEDELEEFKDDENTEKLRRLYLWFFLLELLDNEKTHHIINWIDRETLEFKIHNAHALSVMWGKLRGRDNMTYAKFSRALRYHYKKNVLKKVPKKRYCYQFLKCPKVMKIMKSNSRKRSASSTSESIEDDDQLRKFSNSVKDVVSSTGPSACKKPKRSPKVKPTIKKEEDRTQCAALQTNIGQDQKPQSSWKPFYDNTLPYTTEKDTFKFPDTCFTDSLEDLSPASEDISREESKYYKSNEMDIFEMSFQELLDDDVPYSDFSNLSPTFYESQEEVEQYHQQQYFQNPCQPTNSFPHRNFEEQFLYNTIYNGNGPQEMEIDFPSENNYMGFLNASVSLG